LGDLRNGIKKTFNLWRHKETREHGRHPTIVDPLTHLGGGFRYVYRSPPMERMNPKAPTERISRENSIASYSGPQIEIDQEVKVPTNNSLVGGFKHFFYFPDFFLDNPSH